jgi:hypothetical protein
MKKRRDIKDAAQVIAHEHEYIPGDKDLFWGLALSGGGIRSASFGLGVMQALVAHRPNILNKIDYLSTVSGGGYIGAALTWFLHKGGGTEAPNFPLGQIGSGARTDSLGNQRLNYIRQHGNYLIPGRGLNAFSLIGVILRSMFISLFFYLALLTIVFACLKWIRAFNTYSIDDILGTHIDNPVTLIPLLWIALAAVALLVVASFVFSISTFFMRKSSRRYQRLTNSQKRTGVAWMVVFGLLLAGSVHYISRWLPGIWPRVAAGSSGLLGTVLGFFEFRKSQKPGLQKGKGVLANVRVLLAVFALIYGLFLAAYALSGYVGSIRYFLPLAALVGAIGFFVNLNYVGPHRMYRDRLMETFMPDARTVEKNRWGPATEAESRPLHEMCKETRRPYHLINAHIVLVNSGESSYRGRGGDSFLLSPLHCGSDATGYCCTKKFMRKKPKDRGMTLATAMAISGAAMNPHTGVVGKGITRNRLFSVLMGLLNLRLGYWTRNPGFEKRPRPNFFSAGLMGDVLGIGYKSNNRNVALTDGGHFENLGLYELIRRRVNLIIVADAGEDPDFLFGALANAVERVRVDFGTTIRFLLDYDLKGLLPGSTSEGALAKKHQLSERGFAIADIRYPDQRPSGKLVYLKTTLTEGLPADVYGYKSAHPQFPDQSTAKPIVN